MAEPHDNNLPHDSKEVRLYRLMRMQNNIDTYSAVLGILGAILAWAQSCYTRFTDAVTAATVEDGESQDARIILRDKFDVALDYYQKAKEILQAKLDLYPPDDHLLASYGIKISTPRTYQALKEAADAMILKHDMLVGAGDERVIAQAIIDQLTIYRDEFNEALEAAGIEDRETDDAYALQHKYFDEDTERLRLVFKIACLIWGDDDPKLKDLGFVPSSEIWTPGQPDPELPVFPNPPATFTLSLRPDGTIEVVWTGVAGATHMLLEKRKQGEIDWSLVMNGLPADPAEILPYIDPYISPGIWEYRMIPMNGDEHGMEIVAVIVVPEG